MKHALLIALALLLAVTGCSKTDPITGDAARTAVGHYADGFNALIDKIGGGIVKTYFRAVPEAGPEDMSRNLLFPEQNLVSRELSEAKDAFAAGKAAAPASLAHLAGLADELMGSSEAVTAAYAEAQKYYAAENFKDDKGAGGKELHKKMLEQTARYHAAVEKMSAALDEIEDQQLAEELKQYEGNKNYKYWFRKMLSETKRFVTAVEAAEIPKELEAPFTRLTEANAEFAKFVAGKGGKGSLAKPFQPFVEQTDNFVVVATRLRREMAADKPDEAKIQMDSDALVTAYNVVVELGNMLYEVEPYGQID